MKGCRQFTGNKYKLRTTLGADHENLDADGLPPLYKNYGTLLGTFGNTTLALSTLKRTKQFCIICWQSIKRSAINNTRDPMAYQHGTTASSTPHWTISYLSLFYTVKNGFSILRLQESALPADSSPPTVRNDNSFMPGTMDNMDQLPKKLQATEISSMLHITFYGHCFALSFLY